MPRFTNIARLLAAAGVLGAAACEANRDAVGPSNLANPIFSSYVAIGNSITAGFQSNGINDSTQRQSYAFLLGQAMGTRFAYPALAKPGCPPPIANTQTGALADGGAAGSCALRIPTSVTAVLNNVAVPGARALDPTSTSTAASNALTTFILGGKTQVQRALDAQPTFVTVWIGNNDVLQAGLSGILVATPALGQNGIESTPQEFQTKYDSLISELTAGAPGVRGVLIGVAQVAYLPSMSAGGLIFASPAAQAGISAGAGKPVAVLANCSGSASLINVPQIIMAIRAGTHPAVISCAPGALPAPVGDVFVLDPQEQATLSATITAYNDYIEAKAAELGFGYWDPNELFAAKRASGEIPPFPNLASPTETFGPFISLDGVHPSGAAHVLIANALIDVINTTYGTSLLPVQ
jgi:lysophospholipase L1-like esterase